MKRLLRLWWLVLILSVVGEVAIPMFWGEMHRGYAIQRAKSDIAAIETALEVFKTAHGNYPTRENGVAVLVGEILRRRPVDRWGSEYSYSLDRTGKPFVHSNGANRRDEAGLGDDIVSGKTTYRCEDYEDYCLRATDVAAWTALSLAIASLLVGVIRGMMRLWS